MEVVVGGRKDALGLEPRDPPVMSSPRDSGYETRLSGQIRNGMTTWDPLAHRLRRNPDEADGGKTR